MTRALAQDALRYVSRVYKDDSAHNRKMMRIYGNEWFIATCIAKGVHLAHGDRECMAVLQSMVERAICGKGNGGEPI